MIALAWWETKSFEQFGIVVQILIGICVFGATVAYVFLPWYLIWRLDRIQKTLDALLSRDRMKDSKSQTNYEL